MKEEWVNMSVAVTKLRAEGYKIYPNQLSRLAREGELQTKKDRLDKRVRLVELNELREIFASRLQNSNGSAALDDDGDENDES